MIRAIVCLLALTLMLGGCDNVPETSTGDQTSTTTLPSINPPQPTGGTQPPAVEPGKFAVTFEDNAAVTIDSNLESGKRVEAGTVVTFTMTISKLYEGTAEVYVGETKLTPNSKGEYSVVVEADTVISVKGLTLIASSMSGSGTSDSPFLVKTPADLLYIAEQVNASNTTYTNAHYQLENDLDFDGHELAIIGDGSTDNAIFAGYFNGNGKTISNYKIVSNSSQYVGVFGVLQADVTGSGGGTVINLHLKDFTVEASIVDKGAFVGSLVGYSMGGNVMLCSAEEGSVNVYADSNSFSYVGGMIGIQQSLDYNSYAFYSSLTYSHTDVEVYCNSGMIYAAGGMVGYLSESNEKVTAYMYNCYANGGVYGAMRSGGLVGYMASGTSVVNSYATGIVSAQTSSTDKVNSEDFCYAYAGGLVGYAEANNVIAESFSTAELYASASLGNTYAITNGVLACAGEVEEYDYSYKKTTVYNCLYAQGGKNDQIDLTNGNVVKEKLNWNPIDWVFAEGKYPVVNLESEEEFLFELTFKVGETEYSYERDSFMPLSFWYSAGEIGLPARLAVKEGSPLISGGYFFDEACTMPIPESYVPSHSMTIYTTVVDYSAIAGEYELMLDGAKNSIRLKLDINGLCTYTDAGKTSVCGYFYDGKNIIFEQARFGRYVAGALDLINYRTYNFFATVESNGNLTIVGGVYVDEENFNQETAVITEKNALTAVPLKNVISGKYADSTGIYTFYADGTGLYEGIDSLEEMTYTRNGNSVVIKIKDSSYEATITDSGITLEGKTLKELDAFVGSWNVDSKANKVYTFDGAGNWTYSYYGYMRSGTKTVLETAKGTYTEKDGVLTLAGDHEGTAVLEDGVLVVTIDGKSVSFHRDGSYYGSWTYADYGMTLILKGITADGQGAARVEYLYENGTVEAYDLVYALDDRNADRICLYYDNDIFGYLTYVPGADRMNATIYVGSLGTFMSNVYMSGMDEFVGQWIGKIEGIPTLEFNGFGGYNDGYLTIDGKDISYRLDNATLEGTFTYNGVAYTIVYHEEDGAITLTDGSKTATYCRKDAFGDLTLVGQDGKIYTFDGRSSSDERGILYVNGESAYTYELIGGELRIYLDGQVGSITEGENVYLLELNGKMTELRIKSDFTGTWAMSGSLTNMVIGTMGLDGTMPGSVKGTDVTFTMEEDGSLAFVYEGATFYVIWVGEDLVVDTSKEWYLYGNQVYCSKVDTLFGTWKDFMDAGYQFDGMSNSDLTSGMAQSGLIKDGEITNGTAYNYSYNEKMGKYILWTVDSRTGETRIYRLNFVDPSTIGAYVNETGDKAFVIEEGNRLYNMEVTDDDTDITYSFDGFGNVTTSEGNTYSYKLVGEIDYTNGIAVAHITIDGEIWVATINFKVAGNTSITLEKK